MNEQNKNIILGIVVVILIVGGVYYAKNGKKYMLQIILGHRMSKLEN